MSFDSTLLARIAAILLVATLTVGLLVALRIVRYRTGASALSEILSRRNWQLLAASIVIAGVLSGVLAWWAVGRPDVPLLPIVSEVVEVHTRSSPTREVDRFTSPALPIPATNQFERVVLLVVLLAVLLLWRQRQGRQTTKLALAAQWSGIGGTVIAAVALLYTVGTDIWDRFQPGPPPAPIPLPDVIRIETGNHRDSQTFFEAGTLGPFQEASDEPEPDIDLLTQACLVRTALASRGSDFAFVIGRHDRRRLSEEARESFGTNSALAQLRAEVVVTALKDPSVCIGAAPPIDHIVSVSGGPRSVWIEGISVPDSDRLLEEDRTVEVHGLSASQPTAPPTTKGN